jgi:proline iminopeptidase
MKKVLKIVGVIVFGLLLILIIFSVSMFFITKGDHGVPLTVEQDSSIPHIKIGKNVFHSETFGNNSNEVVIVIHGGPGNDYRALLPLKPLSDKYFVVFYDQRGTGLSPRVDPKELSLESSLQDLSDIIDFYAPGRKVNIIGHSWGGMLASGYIAQHPERVHRAVLAEPGMLTSEQAGEFMEEFKIDLSWDLTKILTRTLFESFHIKTGGKQSRADYIFGKIAELNIEGNPMRKYFCDENNDTGYFPFWRMSGIASQAIMRKGQDEEGNLQIDLVSGLDRYPGKVLFIVGECNQIIGEEYQKEHMKYFTNAEMVVIKNAGHTMLGEKPEECLRIINKYFDEPTMN